MAALWQVDALAHAARRDAGLGLTALRVLIALVQHANADRLAWPSTARLAEMLGMTCPAVSNGLAELADAGWIEKAKAGRRAWLITPINSLPDEYSPQSENSSVNEGVSLQDETEIHSTVKRNSSWNEQKEVLKKKEEGGMKETAPRARTPKSDGPPVDLLSPETQERIRAVRDMFGRHPDKSAAVALAAVDPGKLRAALARVQERGLSRFGTRWFLNNLDRLAAEHREQTAAAPAPGPVVIDGATGAIIDNPRPARAATGRAAMGEAIRRRLQS